ncbi:MAG TPA: hypothetical protein VNI84_14240, partial [Pyrinomonadaceae bacterium]|nr:hypothetical protein [Pyrinomonadaceae bacterium]
MNPFGTRDTRLATGANTFTGTQTINPALNTSALIGSGYSLTGLNAQPLLDLSGTWNTTGTPTLIKANVTDTASNAGSNLLDLQVGGLSKFSVTKQGNVNSTGDLYPNALIASAGATVGAASFYKFTGRSIIQSPLDGNLLLTNAATT